MKQKRKGKTKGLRFETTRAEKKKKSLLLWLAFIATVILIALLSIGVYLEKTGYFETNRNVSGNNMQKEVSILVGSVDSDGELVYLSWMTMNTKKQSFTITPISPKGSYGGQTYTEIYGTSTKTADIEINCQNLKKAISDQYNVSLDRYIILPESAFPRLLNTLGNYTINLDTEVAYDGDDFSIHILTGERTLTGARFFNYLCYVGENYNNEALHKQANLMADFLKQELTEKNAKKGQTYFESLSNYITTDITTSDFSRYSDFLLECSTLKNLDITVN